MISHILTHQAAQASQPLHVVLSGVAGSTSLACWIVLLLPQLIEQWRLKSADGIAIGFISIWFLGDVTNLAGAIWAGLLPEVVFLAIWFCCADFLMIISYYHYKRLNANRHRASHTETSASAEANVDAPVAYTGQNENYDPTQPLLNRSNSDSQPVKTGSHHHHRRDSLAALLDAPPKSSILVQFILPIIFVFACGGLGYFISRKSIPNDDIGIDPPIELDPPMQLGPQILGYLSAILYLGARIPQIIQNYQKRSVEGLSLLFFIFSVLGNVTYAAQILLFRWDRAYIMLNLSWILGSVGTLFEDSVIFIQFYMYRNVSHDHYHHHHHHHGQADQESAILD
ncbi:PQ-loop-domain-containing protein [Nadsonia fulvescens var. elongata DSM 6958]|uniref:PQ-loop-domain-containing protein n=1 Tax=Nadsonia fulvescens var. elongata DSM 6958 TaxID=857566 RepID=A0A1E3PCI0_9ASCO|nr:PQ-loop-domain-containing protein [Nadsonia fulvescens var. elongata DSM 6958]